MRKQIFSVIIFIISIFFFGSKNVYAEDDLCELSNRLNPISSIVTVCTLTGDVKIVDSSNSNNNKTEKITININYTPGYGLWELEVAKGKGEKIRKTSASDLFKSVNSGDYSVDQKNFSCPKSFSKITYKSTKKMLTTDYNIQKIDFSKSKGKAKLTTDFPSSVVSYSKNMVSKIEKYECTDKNLKKIKENVDTECNLFFCLTDTTPKYVLDAYGNNAKGQKFLQVCLASGKPLTELIKQPQKDILSAMRKKIDECKDCSKYSGKEKENCEENVQELETKAEVTENVNEFWNSKVDSADAKANEQPIIILEPPINIPDGSCSGIFGEKVTEDLNIALKYVKYIGPVLIVVLGILDFIKAVASGENDAFNKAWKRLLTRLIVAILLFFVVDLVKFLFHVFGITVPDHCLK